MSWLVFAALLGAAQADEPAPSEAEAEAPAESTEEADYVDVTGSLGPDEIIVVSEHALRVARDAVIAQAKAQGYRKEIRRRDRTILRHDAVWKGEIVLHDDGRVEVKRQPVQFRPPGDASKPLSWLTCAIPVFCMRLNGQLMSQRRFLGFERDAWAGIAADVAVLHERISDVGLEGKLAALPEQLIAMWEAGAPLEEGAPRLPGPVERRAEILRFWDSRTDTEWGDAVRSVVESFCRAVVQTGEHPFTVQELEEFNRRRQSSRALVLTTPAE